MIDRSGLRKLISKIMLIVSMCAFFLLLLRIDRFSIIASVLLTVFFCMLGIDDIKDIPEKKGCQIFACIISFIFGYLLFENYISIYFETEIVIIKEIAAFLEITYLDLIRFIGIAAAITSLFFLYLVSYRLLSGILFFIDNVDSRRVFRSVFNKMSFGHLLGYSKILAISIFAGFVFLLLVFMIPTELISANVRSAAAFLSEEGMYPYKYDWCTSRLDNATDSIMLLELVCESDDSLLERAMNVNRETYGEDNSYRALVNIYAKGKPAGEKIPYARYWHGYLVTLKPLMCFLTYEGIRVTNLLIQTALDIAIVFLLVKKGLKDYIIPYILSLFMINPLVISDSLQYSTCFYLMSFFSILVLYTDNKKLKYWQIFALSGIAVAYFDFLTYPIAVLGVPLIFYLIKNKDCETEILLGSVIKMIFIWFISYALMWISKWVLASIFTDNNIIVDGIRSVLFRTSNDLEDGDKVVLVFSVVAKNIFRFLFTPFSVAVILYLGFVIAKRKEQLSYEDKIMKSVPYFLIGLLPIIWYVVLKNHSMIHSYFTNKALIVTAFALMSSFVTLSKNHE